MKDTLKNKKGSAIVWAMLVAGFLLIMVSAMLTLSLAYSRRSLNNVDTRQLYLTARSGVDLVVREFTNPDSEEAPKIYAYLQEQKNHSWTVENLGFAEPGMGDCSLKVMLKEPKPAPKKTDRNTPEQPPEELESILTVVATARKNGRSQTVKVTLIGVLERVGDPPPKPPATDPEVPVDPSAPVPEPPRLWYVSAYENGGRGGDTP